MAERHSSNDTMQNPKAEGGDVIHCMTITTQVRDLFVDCIVFIERPQELGISDEQMSHDEEIGMLWKLLLLQRVLH